jgi:stage IV sporulation protein FB
MSSKFALKLFSYKGTPIYLKYWYLLLFLFIDPYTVMSIFIAILFHELSHVRTAKKLGYNSQYVFIDILHGGALIDSNYENNKKNAIKIALAGPMANIFIAFFLLILSVFLSFYLSSQGDVIGLLSNCIYINIVIGLFNLIPVFPLDGGRILKYSLELSMNNKEKANKLNGYISLFLSILIIIFSIYYKMYILSIFSIIFILTSISQIKIKNNNERIG